MPAASRNIETDKMFLFLTIVQAVVAAALVGIILMQRSEGGGLGIGGSPTGLMSARGAADFMTRTTRILAIVFVLLSIALAAIAAEKSNSTGEITTTLERDVAPVPAAPAQTSPAEDDPLADVTQ